MKPPRVLIACLSLALAAMTMFSHVSTESHQDGQSKTSEDQRITENPCQEVWENTTVSTPEGLVLCIVPSEEELLEKLKSVGGYNKHYVAVTQEEAENFEPILPGWDGAATTRPTRRPSRCRRRRRGHPSFRRRRYWKGSIDLNKLGWVDEKDDPKVQNSAEKKQQSQTKRSDKNLYSKKILRKEDNELQRSKRFDQPGIKESTKVGCVTTGEKVGSFYQMCNKCQRRTELNIDRFPRYINEVTCESAGGTPSDGTSYCKPKIGKCVQGYLSIDLLVRTHEYDPVSPPSGMYFKAFKQIWVPYTHKIRSCCECLSMY